MLAVILAIKLSSAFPSTSKGSRHPGFKPITRSIATAALTYAAPLHAKRTTSEEEEEERLSVHLNPDAPGRTSILIPQ